MRQLFLKIAASVTFNEEILRNNYIHGYSLKECAMSRKKKQKRVEYKFVRFFIKSVEFFNIFLR